MFLNPSKLYYFIPVKSVTKYIRREEKNTEFSDFQGLFLYYYHDFASS